MTAEPRAPAEPPAPVAAPPIAGLPPEADFMSVAEFFESLRWEPAGADADSMTAEEFIASL